MRTTMSCWFLCWSNNKNLCLKMSWYRKTFCRSKQSKVCQSMFFRILWWLSLMGMSRKLSWHSFWIQTRCWQIMCWRVSITLFRLFTNQDMRSELWPRTLWRCCNKNMQRLSCIMSNVSFTNKLSFMYCYKILILWKVRWWMHFKWSSCQLR